MDKKEIKKLIKEIKKSEDPEWNKVLDLYYAWFLGDASIPNEKKARAFFEKMYAKKKDNIGIAVVLAKSYMEAKDIKRDYNKAESLWLEIVKTKPGFYRQLGDLFAFKKYGICDYQKALEYYKKNEKFIGCLVGIADLYFNGEGVKEDFKKALEYYLKAYAIDPKEDWVACQIGAIYLFGSDNVKVDVKKAIKYFEEGIAVNPDVAYGQLGYIYSFSKLVKIDVDKAYDYLKKSADLDNGQACYNLARLLTYEDVDSKHKNPYFDLTKAADFARKGARLGNENCIKLCEEQNVSY